MQRLLGPSYYAGLETDFARRCYVYMSAAQCGTLENYNDEGCVWSQPIGTYNCTTEQYEAHERATIWPGSAPVIPVDFRLDCRPGEFVDQKLCRGCSPGMYNSEPRATACRQCTPGMFSSGSAAECTKCLPGTFRDFGSQNCSKCDVT